METLGEYLRNKREEKNISLDQVAQVTKINISYLQAIENDDFHMLPASTFVKGFLRHYAQCIGLDPEDVVFRFKSALQSEKEPPGRLVRRKGVFKKSGLIVFFLLFLGFVVWLFLNQGAWNKRESATGIGSPRQGSEDESRKTILKKELGVNGETLELDTFDEVQPQDQEKDRAPEEHRGEQGPQEQPEKAQDIDASRPEATRQPITLSVHAGQTTWIRVSIDAAPSFEVTLQPDERVVWKADEKIHLRVGNAGGIQLVYNGKVIEGLGKTGEVVQIAFPLPQE